MVRAQLHTSLMHFCINGSCFSTSIAARDIYHGNPIHCVHRIRFKHQLKCITKWCDANYPHSLHILIHLREHRIDILECYQARENFHCSFDLCPDNNIVMIIVVSLSHSNKMKIPRQIVNHSTIGVDNLCMIPNCSRLSVASSSKWLQTLGSECVCKPLKNSFSSLSSVHYNKIPSDFVAQYSNDSINCFSRFHKVGELEQIVNCMTNFIWWMMLRNFNWNYSSFVKFKYLTLCLNNSW